MSSPTNLTDSLTRLRERKNKPIATKNKGGTPSAAPRKQQARERRFATDLFMIFAYTLLGVATLCQLIFIVRLDII